ncbi:MAG: histidine kinase [Luteolibacter sp.]|uniref:histidine kinase n=1 Tax=Luteolibacter sp. TaxID=1962973 RepID=UPI003266CFEF
MPRRLMMLAPLLILSGIGVVSAKPGDYHPNDPDAHTLHLWHFDEGTPPFSDGVENGTPLQGLLNGARAGQPSLPGLGNSVSFDGNAGGTPGASDFKGAILIAGPTLANGAADNVAPGFRYFGPDGAFTYEMIVKLNVLPADAPGIALELVSMEGDGDDRIFNLRIEKEGYLAFIPLPHGGASGGAIGTIPTSGPDAPDTTSWFHVAVTYDGNGGVANNVRLYWTRLRPGVVSANRIGNGTLSADFNGKTGDFAIGNEARSFYHNAEAEPFPGCIDEVRISGVARNTNDFFFVPPDQRTSPEQVREAKEKADRPALFKLGLNNVFVDSKPVEIPKARDGELQLGSGLHRLDFDFGFNPELLGDPSQLSLAKADPASGRVKLRCQLEGIDERWQETDLGMSLVCQALDRDDRILSQSRFLCIGRSAGWETSPEDSVMSRRVEPVYIPNNAKKLKLILTSGSPDTTGFLVIDYFGLHALGEASPSLWVNGAFTYDAKTTSPAGSPEGWRRDGGDPAIARMIMRSPRPGVGLVDGDQTKHGEWSSVQEIGSVARRSNTCSLSWYEAYNVIGGSTHRATYVNVPPGNYTFRAIGLAGESEEVGDEVSLAIMVHPPFWQQFWFWPVVAAGSVGLLAAAFFMRHRQRAKRSLERLKFQNALEKDRTRIARDMHDDLGTRVTFINMSAALAQRDIEKAPENAKRHLTKMNESTRDLILAMDDLVWAVDPAHDTLDHLASHLAAMAGEMFRDSPVRCRLDIPSLLPALPLGSEVRHHIALAVKEAFHNVLCHAGPCEVFFSLAYDGQEIRLTIRDTGVGFDSETSARGHGLDNLTSRFKEIGGTCKIDSSPGCGTCIVLRCRVIDARGSKS